MSKCNKPIPNFVCCPECGYEQEDMGRSVKCDGCGYGPMPTTAPARKGKT